MYISITIICERFEIMQKKFNPIIDGPPPIFCEDVYLLDKYGKVILCRQESNRKMVNIFDVIDKDEIDFIEENAILSNITPLLLVKSTKGVVILDISLLNKKGVFMAIIPHFSKKQTFEILKTECSFLAISPKIKTEWSLANKRELTNDEHNFAGRLKMLYYLEIYSHHTHGKTNAEIAEMMLDFAHEIASFVGCGIECNIRGISIFEIKNELCIYSYKFMLFIFCFASRIYSEKRYTRIDIYFDEMGIFINLSFEIADIYKNIDIVTKTGIINLIKHEQNNRFLLEHLQNERELLFCVYLWQHSADYEHIKKKRTDIIYEMKGE